MFYIYVLRGESGGSIYMGSTADLDRRLVEHNTTLAIPTKLWAPWQRVCQEAHLSRSLALLKNIPCPSAVYFKEVICKPEHAAHRLGGSIAVILDKVAWEMWEMRGPLSQPSDFRRNMALLEAMYEHACALGAFPPSDPMEGIGVKIKLAKALNVRAPSGTNRPRA